MGEEPINLLGKRNHESAFLAESALTNEHSELRKERAVKKVAGRWSKEERNRFMQAVDTYGYDWLAVEEFVGSRTLK